MKAVTHVLVAGILVEVVMASYHCKESTVLTLSYPAGQAVLRSDDPIHPTAVCFGPVEGLPAENYHVHVEVGGDFTIQQAPVTVTTTATATVTRIIAGGG